MTTPEKLRRRQLVEGALLIAIGIGMLVQSAYFAGRDEAQNNCMSGSFRELSSALDARSDLNQRETSQNKALWLIYADAAGLVKDDPTKPLSKADQQRLQRQLVAQLLEYRRVIGQIERERQDNPVPPYPEGRCE